MKILLCTGIYPPQIGGPAQYAKRLKDEFDAQGHSVKILTYIFERKLPTLIRHKLFFLRTLFSLKGVDLIIALDTFSVGWPAVCVAKIFNKKIIIRTGGDFLWESYVERTGEEVFFRDFYDKSNKKFNLKEKIIFYITKFTIHNVSALVFSTHWQRDIFTKAYKLNPNKNYIIENFYGSKFEAKEVNNNVYIGGVRPLKWKNLSKLKEAFEIAKKEKPEISLDLENAPYEEFLRKIESSYAVILVSFGDISPNMILDAIRYNKPFILSRENGLYDKLKDIGIFVDPNNVKDIAEKILYLSDKKIYDEYVNKIKNFNFVHTYKQIAEEFIAVYKKT
jgi:glycosyltransferase involved in cell wall biosynthesis